VTAVRFSPSCGLEAFEPDATIADFVLWLRAWPAPGDLRSERKSKLKQQADSVLDALLVEQRKSNQILASIDSQLRERATDHDVSENAR